MNDDRSHMPATQTRPVRRFAVEAAVALAVFTTLVFVGIFWRTATLAYDAAREQASSYIDLLVDARSWNAHYDGVWVLKTPGVESNPFLAQLGVEADTSTVSGTQLTLRNPAIMTDELSRLSQRNSGVRFRLTSLKPIDPADAPDAWERQALLGFEAAPHDVSVITNDATGHVLRMMRPLTTTEACLRCHAQQGYRVGDVRGAISLTVPLAATDRFIAQDAIVLGVIFLTVVAVGGAVGYRLVSRMASQVAASERELHTQATTDALTEIANRRAVLGRLEEELVRAERANTRLGVIELDADHFKRVNDAYGHAAGDTVLRAISSRVHSAVREYDIIGRLGGEEFLVVAPELDTDGLAQLAERVRVAVGATPVESGERSIAVTVSLGATLTRAGDTVESVMARADAALYAAKDAGRNRVVLAPAEATD